MLQHSSHFFVALTFSVDRFSSSYRISMGAEERFDAYKEKKFLQKLAC